MLRARYFRALEDLLRTRGYRVPPYFDECPNGGGGKAVNSLCWSGIELGLGIGFLEEQQTQPLGWLGRKEEVGRSQEEQKFISLSPNSYISQGFVT
jgi:hypothetical protein